MASWAALGRALPAAQGDPSPLLSIGEATPGALLGFPVEERHEHPGESPTKGHKYDEGSSLLGRKAERAGTIQPGEVSGEISSMYINS